MLLSVWVRVTVLDVVCYKARHFKLLWCDTIHSYKNCRQKYGKSSVLQIKAKRLSKKGKAYNLGRPLKKSTAKMGVLITLKSLYYMSIFSMATWQTKIIVIFQVLHILQWGFWTSVLFNIWRTKKNLKKNILRSI